MDRVAAEDESLNAVADLRRQSQQRRIRRIGFVAKVTIHISECNGSVRGRTYMSSRSLPTPVAASKFIRRFFFCGGGPPVVFSAFRFAMVGLSTLR